MKVLLDTSACLAHFRGESGADQVQELFVRDDVDILLCSVTLAEMARRLRELGVPKAQIWRIVADYEDLAVEIVPVGTEIARKSDEICLKTTSRLPLADALIAAAAASRGATLVHRDIHMRSIPRSRVKQIDLAAGGKP